MPIYDVEGKPVGDLLRVSVVPSARHPEVSPV